jgi:UDP-glucose 4-epimerase
LEIIKTFEKVNNVEVPYKIVARREGDIEKVWADPSYANNELGWTATETVEETLRSAWEWELNYAQRANAE